MDDWYEGHEHLSSSSLSAVLIMCGVVRPDKVSGDGAGSEYDVLHESARTLGDVCTPARERFRTQSAHKRAVTAVNGRQ